MVDIRKPAGAESVLSPVG